MVKRGEIVLHLRHVGHTAEDHRHAGDLLHPPKRPGRVGGLRPQRVQLFLRGSGQIRQLPAAHRLHDPDGNAVPVQKLTFFLRLLQRPVKIVQLDLTEFHLVRVLFQKRFQRGHARVGREAQVADTPVFLLLQQIREDVPALVFVDGDGIFIDVVQQIEIEILHAALFQLPFEHALHVIARRDLVSGELVGQIKALARVLLQNFTDDEFRLAAVIRPGGIKIVDALRNGLRRHGGSLLRVDGFVLPQRQPHRAEPELRKLQALKVLIDHSSHSFLSFLCEIFKVFVGADRVVRPYRDLQSGLIVVFLHPV